MSGGERQPHDYDVDKRFAHIRVEVLGNEFTDVVRVCERFPHLPDGISVYVEHIDAVGLKQHDERGLYEKYHVCKDGEAVADCFVLEPDSDSAAREALIRYAEATDDEELAEDLREWVSDLCTRGDDGE